jgi:tetratricopeptide (TPR) repeat protein
MTHDSNAVNSDLVTDAESYNFVIPGKLFWHLIEVSLSKKNSNGQSRRQLFAQRKAVKNWLTKYEPPLNASKLDKIRGYLEAFHHLCELESWEESLALFFVKLKEEYFLEQLSIWGYHQESIELVQRLLSQLGDELDICLWDCLGTSYSALGEYEQAMACYKKSQSIAQENPHYVSNPDVLNNMGEVYFRLGEHSQAIDYYQKSYDASGKEGILINIAGLQIAAGEYSG